MMGDTNGVMSGVGWVWCMGVAEWVCTDGVDVADRCKAYVGCYMV